MRRYAPRLIAAGSAPAGALVEPLIVDPPKSPLGEHELVPQVAWMVERDGAFVHVAETERVDPEVMRGSAELTKLDGTLSNETLDDLPGVNIATSGLYAAEIFLDRDHLAAIHEILGFQVYLAAAPRRGRFLVGGMGAGIEGMRTFLAHVRREHDEAPAADRISPVTMLVRDAAARAVVGELHLAALAQAAAPQRR
jgi:hypothetical protein